MTKPGHCRYIEYMRCLILHLVFAMTCSGCEFEDQELARLTSKTIIDESNLHPLGDPNHERCEPGEVMGQCQLCDHKGRVRSPLIDPECGDVDCSSLNHLLLLREGEESVCMAVTFGTLESPCTSRGLCAAGPSVDICEMTSRTALMRVVSPCSEIVDCETGGEPRIVQATQGTPCEGGQCISGQCIAKTPFEPSRPIEPTAECGMFPATPFCDEGHDDGIPFCEFRAETPDFRSCNEICAAAGSWCLAAWDDERNTCVHQERQTCNTRELDQVCRCAQPSITRGDPFGH